MRYGLSGNWQAQVTANSVTGAAGRERVGGLVTLAEAGYLRDALREQGLHAVIPEVPDGDAGGAMYAVLVPIAELSAAMELRGRLLPEDHEGGERGRSASSPGRSAVGKAAAAGALGMIVAIRIGRGSPGLTALYCLVLGLGVFLWVFLSSAPQDRSEDNDRN